MAGTTVEVRIARGRGRMSRVHARKRAMGVDARWRAMGVDARWRAMRSFPALSAG